jgi:hypothetical protein
MIKQKLHFSVQVVRRARQQDIRRCLNSPTGSHAMPVTDKLPPLAVQAIKTLRQTYDHRGPEAFDRDAAKVFHAVGYIIAQVCGRERVAEAIKRLEAALIMESIGERNDSAVPSIH